MKNKKMFNQMNTSEQKQYLIALYNNPQYLQEIKFQDECDAKGTNLDALFSSVRYESFLDYKQYKYGKAVHSTLEKMSLSMDFTIISSPPADCTIQPLDLPRYCLHQSTYDRDTFGKDNARLIKQNDLNALLFQEGNFFASIDPHITSSHSRGLYWGKTGRLLYTIDTGGKGSIELGISYLDPETKSPLRLISIFNPRHNYGDMIKVLLPLNIRLLGSCTMSAPPQKRFMKKSIEIAHLHEINEEFRKLLYKIGTQKKHDPQKDLADLRQYALSYMLSFKTTMKAMERIGDTQFTMDYSSPLAEKKPDQYRNSKYFMDRQHPEQIDEAPVNTQEIVEKIRAIHELNLGISDNNIKIILGQYFQKQEVKSCHIPAFVNEIHSLRSEFEHCTINDIILKQDLLMIAQQAWETFQTQPGLPFTLDKSDFDDEFKTQSCSPLPSKKPKTDIIKISPALCEVLLYPKLGAKPIYDKIIEKFQDRCLELKDKHNRGQVPELLNTAFAILRDKGILSSEAKFIRFNLAYDEKQDKMIFANGHFVRMTLRDLSNLHEFLDYNTYLPARHIGYSENHMVYLRKRVIEYKQADTRSKQAILEEIRLLCSGEKAFIQNSFDIGSTVPAKQLSASLQSTLIFSGSSSQSSSSSSASSVSSSSSSSSSSFSSALTTWLGGFF